MATLSDWWKSFRFKAKMNLWPPLRGAGVHVKSISKDMTTADVELKLHWWNRNHEKIQFGGSLAAMTDPFFGLILARNLGKDYLVLDKEARIKFKNPGKGTVTAHFNISAQRIAEIKQAADENYKVEPSFTVQVVDKNGLVVAEVEKLIYVRRRDKKPLHGYKPPSQ